jgi:hypothetical protein
LSRYVGNQPASFIDSDGLILAAIDGTESDDFRNAVRLGRDTGVTDHEKSSRSHTWNFYRDAKEDPKEFWDGPELLGLNTNAIVLEVYNWIKDEYFRLRANGDCSPPIDLVGHSRGGYIAVEVARRISNRGFTLYGGDGRPWNRVKEQIFPDVRFLGLYDPVDMDHTVHGLFDDPRTIPSNVKFAANVLAAHRLQGVPYPQERSRGGWTRVDAGPESPDTLYSELYVFGTHSALGGAPWDGPHPKGHGQGNDIRAAIKTDQFVRARAIDAGVNIQQKTEADYGYKLRISPRPTKENPYADGARLGAF